MLAMDRWLELERKAHNGALHVQEQQELARAYRLLFARHVDAVYALPMSQLHTLQDYWQKREQTK